MTDPVADVGRIVARVAERMGLMSEADFMRYFGEGRPAPNDGGQVSSPGFMEEVREMDAKWERGEYPIQRVFRDPSLADPTEHSDHTEERP